MKKHIIFKSIALAIGMLVVTSLYLLYSSTKVDSGVGARDVEVVTTHTNVTGDATQIDVVKVPTQPTVAEQPKTGFIAKVTQKIEEKKETFVDQVLSTPSLVYDLPFMTQAPYANWDPPYDEACEEATMIMVHAYSKGQRDDFSLADADKKILENIAWQEKNGYDIDLTAQETVQVLKEYFGLTSTLLKNPTAQDIKDALTQGKLVIAPAAGRLLGNPYFTAPGPIYHMIPIIGYDDNQKEFITHDPGTKRGKNFHYSYDVLMNAIHDWNEGDVLNGEKVIILVATN